jgi:hypothetical protein
MFQKGINDNQHTTAIFGTEYFAARVVSAAPFIP